MEGGSLWSIIFKIIWYACIPAIIYLIYMVIRTSLDLSKNKKDGLQYGFITEEDKDKD